MNKKTFKDIEVTGKKVLVRVDFNVPMDESYKILDDTRIKAALPTINYLIHQGAKVILCSHLGRPKGMFNPKYSLAPVVKRLQELLGINVKLASDCIGESAKKLTSEMQNGEVVMLENIRCLLTMLKWYCQITLLAKKSLKNQIIRTLLK